MSIQEHNIISVAFTGAQNTGKSTVISDLVKVLQSPLLSKPIVPIQIAKTKYNYRTMIETLNLKINQAGNLASQRLIFNSLVTSVGAYKEFEAEYHDTSKDAPLGCCILDRSPIDAFIYTKFLLRHPESGVTVKDVEEMYTETIRSCQALDYIFYIPVAYCSDIKLEASPNNFRSLNPAYREEIGKLFENFMTAMNFKGDLCSTAIGGSREQRVWMVLKTMGLLQASIDDKELIDKIKVLIYE